MMLSVSQRDKFTWGVLALAGLSSLALACGAVETTSVPTAVVGDVSTSAPIVESASAPEAPQIQPSGDSVRSLFGGANRRSPFVPLDNPEFLIAADALFLGDDNLVMGLNIEGQARAYPIGMVYYHHVVNDNVGGRPMLVTY
jgi:hypothetical protein